MMELERWLADNGQGSMIDCQPLAGGDICRTERITTTTGAVFCVKQQTKAPEDFFSAEARGLAALRNADCLRVPEVYTAEAYFLVMEYIAPGHKDRHFWQALGTGLGHLHRLPMPHFGFDADNFCGRTPQPNPKENDGHHFFAEYRLKYQATLALAQGRLTHRERSAIDQLCERLPDLIPTQAPALLHGDLWAGNIHCTRDNQPVLIDPATYWGWPEADIAMTRLFGGFPEDFYMAYLEAHPLDPGWQERLPLYNLYHLLNHLNLFGSSYHSQVVAVIEDYVSL